MTSKILIVEDEVLVALEMESILQEAGYQVVGIAADLDGAIAFADRNIELALVDLNLRDGLTGPQIGARLANEFRVGVLFVTANPRLLGNGIAGTIGVLTKPTDPAALTAAVDYALRWKLGEPAQPPAALKRFS